jgi:phosphoribosylformimino-5-aminoimidazole carboxamide ribonucleotide (ProFAR) isomerase
MYLWHGQQVVMHMPDATTIKLRGNTMKIRVRGWMEKLRLVYKGELNPLWDIGMKCVVCTRHSVEFDGQGFGWCREHEIEVKARYGQSRVRVTNSGVIETTQSMFKEDT